jgi:hypothetical protein
MALTSKSFSRWPPRLLFFVRFVGLTGFLALLIGGFLVYLLFASTPSLTVLTPRDSDSFADLGHRYYDASEGALTHQLGDVLFVTACLIFGGSIGLLLCLLVEGIVVMRWAAVSRGAAGFLTFLQIGLALALLIGVNVYSFRHYLRLDWTRDERFTLDEQYQRELRQLQGETTVIVYERQKAQSDRSDKSDAYDEEAANKVAEKVRDLVDQLREFGPQFKVEVLAVKDKLTAKKLRNLKKDNPELGNAIDAAPENSIFFHTKRDGKELVQRLSFNEFYQLDKVASEKADGGAGNLVLRYQGLDPFIHRLLSLDEKRPRVGIAVVHQLLSTESSEEMLTLAGVKKSLRAHGFDVHNVILKKWGDFGPPEPAVATFEENQYEALEDKLADLAADIIAGEKDTTSLEGVLKKWRASTPEELTKLYAAQLGDRKITGATRRRQIDIFEDQLLTTRANLAKAKDDQSKALQDKERLSVNRDSLIEQKRLTDLKAKLERQLADCDLLIVPRMTLINVTVGDGISSRLHRLDQAQVDAIKDFMKAGKPVLACFGPTNEPSGARRPIDPQGPDGLEELLGQLGIQFGKQAVLFNAESKSFAERRTGFLTPGLNVEVPSLDFTSDIAAARSLSGLEEPTDEPQEANPLRVSMKIAAESLGNDLKLSVRHPRPIGFDPVKAKALSYEPEFLLTSKDSWNDDNPFPSRERTPRPEVSKPDDPARGTIEEKRRGPFSIGVAVETPLPGSWYPEKSGATPKIRVTVIGHGHIFVGQDLTPAKEELLLDTCNWLLRRQDHLPREGAEWSYPRVPLSELDRELWQFGMLLGLPVLVAYLGVIVVMIRRLR